MRYHKFPLIFAVSLLILACLAIAAILRADRIPPLLNVSAGSGPVGPGTVFQVTALDEGSGIRRIKVEIAVNGAVHTVLDKEYEKTDPSKPVTQVFKLDPPGRGDLKLSLLVTATDRGSLFTASGNSSAVSGELLFDRTPPKPFLAAPLPAIRQGGSALLLFRASEPAESAVLELGARKFPVYPGKNGIYSCLFAWPYDVEPGQMQARLILNDKLGNKSSADIAIPVAALEIREDTIRISDSFLAGKQSEFLRMLPEDALRAITGDPVAIFRRVNSEARAASYAALAGLGGQTAPRPLWSGPLRRLPKSTQRSNFADSRTYLHDDKVIDRKTHLGLDLASVLNDDIPAAADGVVIKTGYLGIHGNMVLIDHGLGLQTLYSHLSSISVTEGKRVRAGQIIGRTGTSGMAGGDHLHFETLVHGLPVNPSEWLDPDWVSNNIENRLILLMM